MSSIGLSFIPTDQGHLAEDMNATPEETEPHQPFIPLPVCAIPKFNDSYQKLKNISTMTTTLLVLLSGLPTLHPCPVCLGFLGQWMAAEVTLMPE